MRLLITTDTVGGVWTFTRELTEGLLQEGCSVLLVSFGRRASADQAAWADRMARSWPVHFEFLPTEFSLEWMQDNDVFYAESAALLTRSVERFRADVVHANQLCYGALRCGVPTLVTVHSDVRSWFGACRGMEPERSPWVDRYDALVTRGLRDADAVTAPTAWMLAQAEAFYGPFQASAVVANGRSLAGLATAEARCCQAVTVGRLWDEGKDVRLLESVQTTMPLLVAGESTSPDAVSLDAGPGVTYLGWLAEEEVLALFRRSAVYVVTSLYEPFGLAPVEAALCGCAIVARDLPSLREVWGEAAVYFRDAHELSEILCALATDPARVQTIASRAGQRARERYTRELMTARYVEQYRGVLRAPGCDRRVRLDVA